MFAFDASFSDAQFLEFYDSLGEDDLDAFTDSLSRAEARAFAARANSLNNARAGSYTGGQADQFSKAGAFFGRLAFEVADYAADEAIGVGQIKGAAELWTGKNALGENIGVVGQVAGGLNMIPVVGGGAKRILKVGVKASSAALTGVKKVFGALTGVGKKADNVVDGAGRMGKTARKTADAVDDVAPKGVRETLQALPKGKQGHVRTVPSGKALDNLFDSLTAGAKTLDPGTYQGIVKQLPDGTIIRKRTRSKSGGSVIDITFLDGLIEKIHVD